MELLLIFGILVAIVVAASYSFHNVSAKLVARSASSKP
jgi:hypothetical protein